MDGAGDRQFRDTATFVQHHPGRKFHYLVDVKTDCVAGWCTCEFADLMHEWAGSPAIMSSLCERQYETLMMFLSHQIIDRIEPPGINVTIHEIIESSESILVKVGSGISLTWQMN